MNRNWHERDVDFQAELENESHLLLEMARPSSLQSGVVTLEARLEKQEGRERSFLSVFLHVSRFSVWTSVPVSHPASRFSPLALERPTCRSRRRQAEYLQIGQHYG